jgi:hypothetical protein
LLPVITCCAVLAVPSAALAATYRGKAEDAGKVTFKAGKDRVKDFIVLKVPLHCKPKLHQKGAGAFPKGKITSAGRIRAHDQGSVGNGGAQVKFDNTLRGSFGSGRRSASGTVSFKTSGTQNGRRVRCHAGPLHWTAHRE